MKPNKDKTSVWQSALSVMIVALTVVALGSCTKDPTELSMPGGDSIEVRVTFPRSEVTRAGTRGAETGTAGENRLDRVTILVFRGDGNGLENGISVDVTSANNSLSTTQPKWETNQTLIVPVRNPSSPKKIYAIANWDKKTFYATYTETELKNENTGMGWESIKTMPILMSGGKDVTNLPSLFYNVTIDMARMLSKLSAQITITTAVQDYMPHIEWLTDQMTITVGNVPNRSYIIGRGSLPATTHLLDYPPVIAVDDTRPAAGDQTVPATKDLVWKESVYVTENPIMGTTPADKDTSTYVIVQIPYKNRITGSIDYDNYYKLYVNEEGSASPYKVLRNTIYGFNIRILGMGSPINNLVSGNVKNQLIVIDWEDVEISDVEDTPNKYFHIDRTSVELQFFKTEVRRTIATDVADWKLVKADGTTILSFAEGKTAPVTIDGITYTLGGISSAATVTVSKPATSVAFATQRLFFIAKNLKVPFTVVSDNGFIPNSVLSQSFTAGGTTYSGWPLDKLPAKGLQLAKQGDKKLPEGIADTNGWMIPWKTANTVTTGTADGLGMGKSSTDAMKGVEYPAAEYCRDMGEGWFLPSKAELLLIYRNLSTLGISYTLRRTTYWTSTEHNDVSSCGVDLGTGTPNFAPKTINNRLRCVRYI